MNERLARVTLGAVIPAALVTGAYLPFALVDDLPDRFATHFDGSGAADGSMTPTQLAITAGVLVVIGAAMCIGTAVWRRPLPAMAAPAVAGLGGFLGAMAALIIATTVIDQRGVDDWSTVRLSGWPLAVVMGGALVVGAVAARLATALPVNEPSHATGHRPTMQLSGDERAVWTERQTSPLLVGLGLASLAAIVAVALVGLPWGLLIVMAVAAVAILGLATFRARADASGLTVSYGPLGWPATRLATTDITSASVIDVRPKDWGGWGYRGSLRLMKRAAVVHRAGPGLRLDLRDGKVFAVTVDDPEGAASLLNAEIARQPSPA